MVGAPYQLEPSNNGTAQPTGAIFTCPLTDKDDGKCTLLNVSNVSGVSGASFYTFPSGN